MNQTMKFSGAVCPSVIPLDDSGQIDLTGLENIWHAFLIPASTAFCYQVPSGICHNERPRTGNAHPEARKMSDLL